MFSHGAGGEVVCRGFGPFGPWTGSPEHGARGPLAGPKVGTAGRGHLHSPVQCRLFWVYLSWWLLSSLRAYNQGVIFWKYKFEESEFFLWNRSWLPLPRGESTKSLTPHPGPLCSAGSLSLWPPASTSPPALPFPSPSQSGGDSLHYSIFILYFI